MSKKHIEVVAAVLKNEGEFLAVQRAPSKLDYVSEKWEFPGGKVEPGETLVTAITRELDEELRIVVTEPKSLLTIDHSYLILISPCIALLLRYQRANLSLQSILTLVGYPKTNFGMLIGLRLIYRPLKNYSLRSEG